MTSSGIGKIYSVDEVRVQITRTKPPAVLIHAIGRAPTTGWSDGQLTQYVYLVPPEDGIQAFDFIAKMPTAGTQVLNVLTPISAHAELPDIDVEHYWGKGVPLKGIRTHAVSNAKMIDVKSRKQAIEISAKMSPQSIALFVGDTTTGEVPSFEEDIKPLFRERDVIFMQAVADFNLHKYEDVKGRAGTILERLKTNMPCDGLWPQSDIDKFEAWKEGGMPA